MTNRASLAFVVVLHLACADSAPRRDLSSDTLHFVVEDVFQIPGRGPVVTGYIGSGSVHLGDTLSLHDGSRERFVAIVSIERFRHPDLTVAVADTEAVALELSGVPGDSIRLGALLRDRAH